MNYKPVLDLLEVIIQFAVGKYLEIYSRTFTKNSRKMTIKYQCSVMISMAGFWINNNNLTAYIIYIIYIYSKFVIHLIFINISNFSSITRHRSFNLCIIFFLLLNAEGYDLV